MDNDHLNQGFQFLDEPAIINSSDVTIIFKIEKTSSQQLDESFIATVSDILTIRLLASL